MAEKQNKREDDGVQIKPLKNSDLTCHGCIFNDKPDWLCGVCLAYPNQKPKEVLDGGPCDKKLTEADTEGMTQSDLDGWFD